MSFLLENLPANPAVERFIDLSFEVSERILQLLASRGMTQRDLAVLLGKPDSLISKWLRGNHNFTLKSIASLEVALGETLVKVQGLEADHTFSESMASTIALPLGTGAHCTTTNVSTSQPDGRSMKSNTGAPSGSSFITNAFA